MNECLPTRGANKSLARPISRCISFDGENISFDSSLVIYINSNIISPIMIINKIYEPYNFCAVSFSFLFWLRTYQQPCTYMTRSLKSDVQSRWHYQTFGAFHVVIKYFLSCSSFIYHSAESVA